MSPHGRPRRPGRGGLVAAAAALAGCAAPDSAPVEPRALPPAVLRGVEQALPGARVRSAERELVTLEVYELEVSHDGRSLEVTVGADGTIVDVERDASPLATLPVAVQQAVPAHVPAGARLTGVAVEEQRAVPGFLPLTPPRVRYELDVLRDGEELERTLDADGRLLPE